MDKQIIELRLQLHAVSQAYHAALADYYAARSAHSAESLINDLVEKINAAGVSYVVALAECEEHLRSIELDEQLEAELQRILRLRRILGVLQSNFR